MTRLRDIYGPGFTQAEYLHALHAGYETGWWDDTASPHPGPTTSTKPTTIGHPTGTRSTSPSPDNHPSNQQDRRITRYTTTRGRDLQ